jgi:CRP-like cAMP-binding protein
MYQHHSEQWTSRRDHNDHDFQLLQKMSLFRGLAEETLAALLSDATVQHVKRNEVIFVEGEPASRLFLVLEGWVKLWRQSEDGQESVIGVFTQGESFAEAAIFDQKGYPVSAVAVEDTRLLCVPGSSVLREFKQNPDYAINVVADLSRHMRFLVRQIEQLSVSSSTERLARFLVMLCPQDVNEAVVRFPVEKSLIAGRLGMQPETLSRGLAKLRKIGVNTKGSMVTISDVNALRNFQKGV